MNKYILLDFDGVITSNRHTLACRQKHRPPNIFGLDWFDPACLEALRAVVDETGADIVISSSWRDLGDDAFGHVWKHNEMPGQFVGTTPIWILTKKEALKAWIKAHPDDRYVILEDADLKLPHQVKTNPDVGLTILDAQTAIIELLDRYEE